ncbi:DUF6288 domain-containing protein [Thermogutta sp.]|uniref:DUF6288 domain-containing protein n=1 Tax=Thermogutta sp. TaxID=1962930 RepID=UPI003C7B80D2
MRAFAAMIIQKWQTLARIALTVAVLACGTCCREAVAVSTTSIPDFTKGDKIPEGAVHDWNLGPTGARGWMYSDQLVTTDARQILVTAVEKGSPADGVLQVGDVILGVNGKHFTYDPRTELGKAITFAESEAARGVLRLLRWRDGTTAEVSLKLQVLGTYSPTAPYNCVKSRRILDRGCEVLARRIMDPSYRPDAIVRSLNALALLASGKPQYLPLVRREAQWAANFSINSFQTWYYGYVMIFLAEYKLATGDGGVMPGLRRIALESARGQSIVGSWGHGFAGPDGRLQGYGMMNSPGIPLTIGLILARRAGVRDSSVDIAIQRSARLIRFYVGKGAVPYGDHHPWIETHEDNGKCGMAAVMFNLLGDKEAAEFFSWMSLASHGAERDCGHTGNFFNILWAMPAVALCGPHATGAWMEEFGAWYFDLARRWDGTFCHQGPPEMTNDKYAGWDCTGVYLLAYAMPLKRLFLTGKQPSVVQELKSDQARSIIADGRGWTNKDRNSFYDALSEEELLQRLTSWSPVVRERAALALARRLKSPPDMLVQMLESPRLEARYGACQALVHFKQAAAPAVPQLIKLLGHKDLWLRVKAAEALVAIGPPAKPALPILLERLSQGPSKEDPRGMEQRYLAYALFDSPRKLLGNSLDGLDRDAFYKAVRAGLRNEDGRARTVISSIYESLSEEDIRPLLPDIYRSIMDPAPSGIMFADGSRLAGLRVLAKYHVAEGMEACVKYAETQNAWGSETRTAELMKILVTYGADARPLIPRLEKLAERFEKGEPDFPFALSQQKAKAVREAIELIKNSRDLPPLVHLYR